jgi:pyruvate,water dikinase
MFTLNPMNGDPSKIAIDANWGLGESVVQGEVVPDSYFVDKVTLEIIKRKISKKSFYYEVNDQTEKVEYVEVASEKQQIACLDDQNVIELAKLGKSIEQYYGSPQDIEWAIDGRFPFPENIFIVQSRPETVWSQKKPEPIVKEKKSAMKLILDRYSKGE